MKKIYNQFKNMLMVTISICLLITATTSLFSQEEKLVNSKFDRRSVSLIPVTLLEKQSYLSEMQKSILNLKETGRYDFNRISKSKLDNFQESFINSGFDKTKYKDKSQLQILENLIKSITLEDILKSSTHPDSLKNRFERSQKRITVSSASAEKINTATTADYDLLISNTYIAVIILTDVKEEEKVANGKGIVYWFKVNLSNLSSNDDWKNISSTDVDWYFPDITKLSLELVDILEVESEAKPNVEVGPNATLDKKLEADAINALNNLEDEESGSKLELVDRAAKRIISEAVEASLGMEDFKIRGTIQNTENGIFVDVGNREGVYLDEGFKIFENRIGNDNKPYSKYIGFSRVQKVGDNKSDLKNDTKLFGIIGKFEPGHTAISHDQFFDSYLNISYKMVNIPKNSGYFLETITGNPIFDNDATSSINFDLGGYYNLARITGVSQLFVGANVSIGLPTVVPNAKITGNFSINPPMTWEANINILKKLWFGRLNLFGELQLGLNTFKLTGTFNNKTWEINTGLNYGAGLNLGLEYAINADINAGLAIGYRYVLPVTKITLIDTDGTSTDYAKADNEKFWEASQYNDLNLGGFKIGLKVSYSIKPIKLKF